MSLGSENFTGSNEDANAFAFAEIVMMLIESKANDKTAPVFKLADLIRMYQTRLEQLDAPAAGKVNPTRLKKKTSGTNTWSSDSAKWTGYHSGI